MCISLSQIKDLLALWLNILAAVHIRNELLDITLELIELFGSNSVGIIEVVADVDEEVRHNLVFYESVVVLEDVDVAEPNHVGLEIFMRQFFVFFEEVFTSFAKGQLSIEIHDFDWLVLNKKIFIRLPDQFHTLLVNFPFDQWLRCIEGRKFPFMILFLELSNAGLYICLVLTWESLLYGADELQILKGINNEQVLSFLIPYKDCKLFKQLVRSLINMPLTSKMVQFVLFSQQTSNNSWVLIF